MECYLYSKPSGRRCPKITMQNAKIEQLPRTFLRILLSHEANSQMILGWGHKAEMAVFIALVPCFLLNSILLILTLNSSFTQPRAPLGSHASAFLSLSLSLSQPFSLFCSASQPASRPAGFYRSCKLYCSNLK